jgi:hypothetical protein
MVGGLVKATAVSAVMAQVKRLVAGGSLGVFCGGSGVGVIVATHFAKIFGDFSLDGIGLGKASGSDKKKECDFLHYESPIAKNNKVRL